LAQEGRIRDALLRHRVLGIDTMAFIYHLEGNEQCGPFTRILFSAVESGECRGVTSVLTLMETLVRPKEIGDSNLRDDYYFALTTFPNLTIRDVDAEVAERAAELRAMSRLRPPDALQIATCLVEGGSAFVTNDERLRSIEDPEIIIMKDYL
jgi:predicted nucleic acid-binding protein